MGRSKTAQRTKGNQKPSSSSRSAELNGGTGGFIGFSGVNYIPAASQMEDECEVAAEFRITLRKLEKKDPTTKLKALQEFFALCESQDVDTLKTVLPFWARIYSKLCLDCNDMVREDAQLAHHLLLNKIKKQFRPYLKDTMPVWLLVMTDPNICVAARANRAFEETFSEQKRPDVLIYCAEEIIKYLSDNILVQSSQTLADKTSSKGESENKYCRIICCSLKSIGLFIRIWNPTTNPNSLAEEKINGIFQSEKFWAFSKNKNALIKTAWFNLISAVIEYFEAMDQEYLPSISKSIFSSINCQESNVLPNIWKSLLLLCLKLPNCWKHYNKPESVCSSILAVLRDGGRGYAIDLYPMLRTLLKLLPVDVISNGSFHENFFRAISSSLRKTEILVNREEIKAIIRAMYQCMSFLQKEKTLSLDQWQSIITYQIIGHLKSSWTDTVLLKDSCLYRETAMLLSEWNESQDSSNKLSYFWEIFLIECNLIIENNNQEELQALINVFENFSGKVTKSHKFVEFNVAPCSKSDVISTHFIQHVSNNVSGLTKNVYDSYVSQRKDCFNLFCCLLTTFPSNDAYSKILNKQSENICLEFSKDVVLPMLNKDSSFPVQDASKLFLHLYKTLNEIDRRNLLLGFKPTISTQALIIIVKSFSKMAAEDEVTSSWLKSAQLGCRAVKEMQDIFAAEAVSGSVEDVLIQKADALALTRFIFSNLTSDPIFSTEYLNQIVRVMRVMLTMKQDSDTQAVSWNIVYLTISLLDSLVNNAIYWKLPETTEVFCILLNYFWFCSADTKPHEVLQAFIQKSISSCVFNLKSGSSVDIFLGRFLSEIKALVYNDDSSFAVVSIASDVVCHFMKTLFEHGNQDDCDIMLDQSLVRDIFDKLIPTENEWMILEQTICKEYIMPTLCSLNISFCDIPFEKFSLVAEKFNPVYPKVCLFLIEVLISLVSRVDQEIAHGACSNISLGEYTDLCVQLLHGECYIKEMIAITIKNTKHNVSEDLESGASRLQEKVGELMQLVNTGNKKHMVKLFRNRCKLEEYLWPVSMEKSLQSWLRVDINAIKLIRESPTDVVNHTVVLQILAPYLSDEERAEILCEKVLSLKNFGQFRMPLSILIEISCLFQSLAAFWATAMVKDIFEILRNNKSCQENRTGSRFEMCEDISFEICVIRMLSYMVYYHKDRLSHADWDFTLCYLSIISSVDLSSLTSEESCVTSLLICAISKLALVVFNAMDDVAEEKETYPSDLLEEWKLVYSQNIYNSLFQLLIECAEYYAYNDECVMLYEVCRVISKSGHPIPGEALLAMETIRISSDGENFQISDKLQILLCHSIRLIKSPHLSIQLVSFSFLKTIQPTAVELWENSISELKDFDIPELPATCISVIAESETKIETFLNARTEDEKAMEFRLVPHTEEYCWWISYLLSFHLVFSFCKASSDGNQQKFASYFGKKGYLHALLSNLLFVLLPFTPNDERSKDKVVESYFTDDFNSATIDVNEHTLPKLAARNFLHCLSLMPAETRYWFMKLEKSTLQSVEKLTRAYVSPIIISSELKLINEANAMFDNMTVKTKEKIGEVVATYTIDETKLDLVLNISPKHPLAPVTFDHSKIGVATAKWRSLNTMLVYRNTTLLNSLLFWKKNVDHRFVGVEECFICYSILQGNVNQVPKLTCRTCKNKFHSSCLYKWFDTANKTTCPICRSPF